MKLRERGNPLLRFLDRYLGIPLVCIFGFFHRKRKVPSPIKRVAILKSAGIGDTVLLSAVLSDLKNAYPHLSLTLFTGTSNEEMAKWIPQVEVVALPMTSPFKAVRKIRQYSFDIWIDCDPWPRINALLSFFSHSCFTIGFETSSQFRHPVYDLKIFHSDSVHELDNYRSLFRSLFKVSFSSTPYFEVESVEKQKAVALHLYPGGSRAYLKIWDKWEDLIRHLLQEGYMVYLTGGKGDFFKLEELKNKFSSSAVVNTAGSSLKKTASILKSCTCAISVDTGIMHLAAALDCPLISLHGPTSPLRWGAQGKQVISLTPSDSYRPCISLGFESKCKQCGCMKSISLESVKRAFTEITSGHL